MYYHSGFRADFVTLNDALVSAGAYAIEHKDERVHIHQHANTGEERYILTLGVEA